LTGALRRSATVAAILLAAVVLPGRPVQAAGDGSCVSSDGVYQDAVPWPQRLLDPGRVWPLTTGAGVRVAVLGTGVDAANAQFDPGQVARGADITTGRAADDDCDGRGTFAAGLIAAKPRTRDTTFAGVAPGARIVPIRYTQATSQGGTDVAPDRLAAAVRAALGAGIRVICVVVPASVDSQELRTAVAQARSADAVIVVPAVAADQNEQAYPTADPSLLSVAAVASDGKPVSDRTTVNVDIAAPGKALVSLAGGDTTGVGHKWPIDNPAYAAAFVAATVALVLAYRPNLSGTEVVHRIEVTAAGTGTRSSDLGWGIVNPYAAVTAEGIDRAAPRPAVPAPTAVAAARTPPVRSTGDLVAIAVAVGGLLVALFLAVSAAVLRPGRAPVIRA
jgi:membrane-anchored mycosin MYCP